VSVLDKSPLPHAKLSGMHKHKAEVATGITSSLYKVLLQSKMKPVKNRQLASKSSTEEPRKSNKQKTEKKKKK